MEAHHQRSESSESNSSGGSAYQLILDHILSNPGSYRYDIPLRTMYTLNSTPRAQPSHSGSQSPSSAESSPTTPQESFHNTKKSFKHLMDQISALPNQPTSLPPSFITSFLRKNFPPTLIDVSFQHALTGLDYLKDLETRRRAEVRTAMERLDISRNTLGSSHDALSDQFPRVADWVKSIEEKERKIEALYTQIYIGLRRWVLINELSFQPLNRHNCYAMLNTLYPPVVSVLPTTRLTSSILKNQRDGFIKYIQSVEKNGPRVLGTLMQQGKAPTDENGWAAVTRTLGMYLQLANSIIKECMDIHDVQSIPLPEVKGDRQPRKVDSGVSFNVSEAGSSSRSDSLAEPVSPSKDTASETAKPQWPMIDTIRPKTPTPSVKTAVTARSRAPSSARHGTALERIARGLRTIGRSRTDVTEMIPDDDVAPPVPDKSRTLRKMQSMGNMNVGFGGSSKSDLTSLKPQPRMHYEANAVAAKFGVRQQSHEV